MLVVGGDAVKCIMATKDPSQLPWKELGVDYVIESTGLFTDSEKAKGHLAAGAKKVIISAPGKGDVKTLLMGVNESEYDPAKHHIVSNASCTTNCLAPVVHVLLKEGIGIETGLMTTIHSYTATQKTVDGPSKKDWRGGRAAAINIIPSIDRRGEGGRRGAPGDEGQAHRHVLPRADAGRLGRRPHVPLDPRQLDRGDRRADEEGRARPTSRASSAYANEELVSTDFIHDERSSIYDSLATLQNNLKGEKRFFKVVSWYDNEWGYSNRCVDLLRYMAKKDGAK